MDRRKFITFGGLASLFPASVVTAAGKEKNEPLANVKEGQVLSADLLNEMINRINRLESGRK